MTGRPSRFLDLRPAGRAAAPPDGRRAGFTLVELIVVILIVALLMAVTIPVVRSGIKERSRRESARQINTLLSSARSEATGTGRPHGVWIERSRIDGQAAFQLFMAEVPPAFTGEVTDSRVFVTRSFSRATGTMLAAETPYIRIWFANNYGTSGSPASPFIDTDTMAYRVVAPGDQVRLRGWGPTYRVASTGMINVPRSATDTTTLPVAYADISTVVYSDPAVGSGLKPRIVDVLPRPTYGLVPPAPTPTIEEITAGSPLIYSVQRSPVRIATSSLELPSETVIDLGLSGITANGTEFATQGGPVVIMFTPQGTVEEVIVGNQSRPVVTPVYLHVGRADQTYYYSDVTPAVNQNFFDGSSYWVMVNNANGTVVTAANQLNDLDGNGVVSNAEARSFARQQLLSSQ